MMICLNDIQHRDISIADLALYIAILAPFVPHMAEEIWSKIGRSGSIHASDWPEVDQSLIRKDSVTLPIQINGRVRSNITISLDTDEELLKRLVLSDINIIKYLEGKKIKKFIYIANRIVNLVI
jgi:leucyl-tRNA synthetase